MQKLRETLLRRIPSLARDTLDVPKPASSSPQHQGPQVRSASCDDIERPDDDRGPGLLNVPNGGKGNRRSKSLDSSGAGAVTDTVGGDPSSADEAGGSRRRSSGSDRGSSPGCAHCAVWDELVRREADFESEDEGHVPCDEDGSQTQAGAGGCAITVTLSPHTAPCEGHEVDAAAGEGRPEVEPEVTLLHVPSSHTKQQRSASLDTGVREQGAGSGNSLHVPKTLRSRSVDDALPSARLPYQKALPDTSDGHERGSYRNLPDWSENAVNGDHLWMPISASGELCYFLDQNICSKQGQRYRCSSCKMILHKSCIDQIPTLPDKRKYVCKPTFRDVGVRQYREQMVIEHHWIHKKNQKGKCKQCSKAFQSKLSFSSGKDVVAVVCSWCKMACHNKEPCFVEERFRERCSLGLHANIILPPSWIVKLPRKGSFKSSLRKSPKRKTSSKRKPKKEGDRDSQTTFVIKPIPSQNSRPLLVFINPRSGGNQGSKLLAKFQWLLNPRQVFDLSQGGPATGIELFRKVPNLRILACGGDGTAGWILSTLDTLGIDPPPAMAVLPLGTGNDLARSLGWGGGYTDEPISKILCNVEEGEVVQLDRWDLKVDTNPYPDPNNTEEGKASLPLDVLNNYFSLGADAYIALEFHEAREAHPEKFSSRLRNKMFYGQAGGKDLLQRKWKDLSDYVSLECDGKDVTPKLKELKVHAIVFLNIPSYSAGTRPWNCQTPGLQQQRTDDGLIEVIGLTTYQLPLLQAGGHGTCIAQCKHVKMATTRTIPMQVDGEPCKLAPSLIEMKLRNKANMVSKSKKHSVQQHLQMSLEKLSVDVARIGMADYENYHYDKDLLRQQSIPLGTLTVQQDADLEQVRGLVADLMKSQQGSDEPDGERGLPSDWCFLDGCTCERFFRIDRAQENIHFITDISSGEVYILEPEHSESEACESIVRITDKPNGDPKNEAAKAGTSSEAPVADQQPKPTDPEDDPALNRGRRPKPPLGRAVRPQALCEPSYFMDNYPEDVIEMSKSDDMRSLKDLHAAGRSLVAVDQNGMTPLHHASSLGHKDVVRFLIANAPAAMIDVPDNERGRTALHWAAVNARRTVCCMLVAAGAALTSIDRQGLTPSQLALQSGDEELAAYLESQKCFQGPTSNHQETAV